MNQDALNAAVELAEEMFEDSSTVLLCGSVVRGEDTHTSDLDIVVFDPNVEASHRRSFFYQEWPVELFVHNLTSYQSFYRQDIERARPSLPQMVAEGRVIRDTGHAYALQKEARQILEAGPSPWSMEQIRQKRYFITDTLDDLLGAKHRREGIFIVPRLAELVHEFALRTNGCWIGQTKWIPRTLMQFDEEFAQRFIRVLDAYYQEGEIDGIVSLVDEVLAPHGGRLFDGFSIGEP
ncbi:nucleotidyltransferase domain-containing protein [Thalassobacillus sp. CUG 92003]|uniref:nucleotidyltransferase domain-containing protein n=1 Tax=Thalassobacillus sp. CUG 92003 TaxID=2736641 RepID=UPI0015E76BE1|nr:nucleotidyltransferase domain-containing protein [Thalassobacillus sp. CUG 92003]